MDSIHNYRKRLDRPIHRGMLPVLHLDPILRLAALIWPVAWHAIMMIRTDRVALISILNTQCISECSDVLSPTCSCAPLRVAGRAGCERAASQLAKALPPLSPKLSDQSMFLLPGVLPKGLAPRAKVEKT